MSTPSRPWSLCSRGWGAPGTHTWGARRRGSQGWIWDSAPVLYHLGQLPGHNSFFLFSFFEPHLVVLRAESWPCTQELLLEGSGDQTRVSFMQGPPCCTITPALFLFVFFFEFPKLRVSKAVRILGPLSVILRWAGRGFSTGTCRCRPALWC